MIIINDKLFINICQCLVNIGNPNPCLLVAVGQRRFFLLFLIMFFLGKKSDVVFCGGFYQYLVNICQCTVLHMYLPTIRYCVLYKQISSSRLSPRSCVACQSQGCMRCAWHMHKTWSLKHVESCLVHDPCMQACIQHFKGLTSSASCAHVGKQQNQSITK